VGTVQLRLTSGGVASVTSAVSGAVSVTSAARQQFGGTRTRARQLRRVDAPDRRDVLARRRIVQLAVTWQLIRLLTVLTAALPVALAGQRAVSGTGTSGKTERERQVDPRVDRVGAFAVLLGSARGEDHRAAYLSVLGRCFAGGARGLGQRGDRLVHRGDRHAGQPLDPLGPVRGRDATRLVETGSAQRDVLLVNER